MSADNMNGIPIEFWGVVIVALSSIFTNILMWYLNYRTTLMRFRAETKAGYIQEVLRDHYKLYNYLRQLEITPIKETALKATEEIQKIVEEHPYNFKQEILNKWIPIYEEITLQETNPENDIKALRKDVLNKIRHLEEIYEKLLGIRERRKLFKIF